MKQTELTILFIFSLFILLNKPSRAQTLYWQSIYPEIYVYDMLYDGETSLYVTGSSGYPYFYRSTDLGTTWTRLGNGYFSLYRITLDSSGVLWGGNNVNGGIFKSTDHGDTWTNSLNSNDKINSIIVSRNNWIWAGSLGGKMLFSSDHGETWDSSNITGEQIMSIAANHQIDIFAGSFDGKIYRTTDSGATWETVYNIVPLGIWGMVIDSSDVIYAYKWNKCLVSSDNGNTWTEIPGPQLERLFLDPFENIYAGLGYRTLDKCSTWTYIGPAINFPDCYCFADSLVFAGTGHGVFLYDPSYQPYTGKNYFPLNIGNQWQYNRVCNGQFAGNQFFSVQRDFIITDKKYFLLQGSINDWVRYDDGQNKFMLRWNDSDYTVMDYTLNEGTNFEHIFYNSHIIINATIIEPFNISIFDSSYFSKGYFWGQGGGSFNENHWIYHSENLGKTTESSYSWGGGIETDCYTTLIRAVIYDSMGVKYYSDGVKPIIIFQPQLVTHNFNLDWNFSVNHSYSCFNQNWNVNFIDTVSMFSYYSNGDSTINNSRIEGINEPNSANYNLSFQLDSTLVKNDFKFYYKIYAVDKGIVPESSSKPASGYYELVYDPNPVSVKDIDTPIAYALQQNFPNPFNNSSVIIYSIPKPSQVLIKIFNTLGEEVATLINEEESAGSYEIEFNAQNLPSGIYFCQMKTSDFIQTRKMILLK